MDKWVGCGKGRARMPFHKERHKKIAFQPVYQSNEERKEGWRNDGGRGGDIEQDRVSGV